MSLKTWHMGKVVMMWGAVCVVFLAGRWVSRHSDEEFALAYWMAWLAGAVTAFVVTWRWFSA